MMDVMYEDRYPLDKAVFRVLRKNERIARGRHDSDLTKKAKEAIMQATTTRKKLIESTVI